MTKVRDGVNSTPCSGCVYSLCRLRLGCAILCDEGRAEGRGRGGSGGVQEDGGGGGRVGGRKGEEEGEDGAAAAWVVAAADVEAAVMFFDDTAGDPEAEAGAEGVLGGVEGLEDAMADGGGHAVAVVGDGDADAAALGALAGGGADAQAEDAAGGHGVEGVADEVGDDLADLSGEAGKGRGGARLDAKADAFAAELVAVEGEDGGEQVEQVGRGWRRTVVYGSGGSGWRSGRRG